ncbi:hypothetical protein [Bradyrhizobium prioriisuperbiae]|uniref:hypothetical protein n=1 Tax=Bradyrhizobium prioriisuperbiae TaxID=2854389 RepID=UPI0028F13542|nr:hypothetical protein [Bradyrhizobium prioritasuperba]
MQRRDLAEGPTFLVWVRGLTGPQPQLWGEDAFYGPVAERERVVLAVRALRREEAGMPLRELAARYPAPEG